MNKSDEPQDPRQSENESWGSRDRRTGYRRRGDLTRTSVRRWLLLLTWALMALFVVNVVFTAALGVQQHNVNQANHQTEVNSDRTEKAVCTVLIYVERQLPNVQNPRAAEELLRLADGMRDTGVRCQPRSRQKRKPKPTPTPSALPSPSATEG